MARERGTEPDGGSKSWWTTLPGLLTGVAALVTAVTGLLVALPQLTGDDDAPGATASAPAGAVGGDEEGASAGGGRVSFPEGARATLGQYRYDVLSGTTEPNNPGELRLELRVRLTNMSPYDANFWDGTFRLRAAGDTNKPEGGLNKVVPGGTDEEGTVVFTLPSEDRSPVLILGEGDEAIELQLTLEPPE